MGEVQRIHDIFSMRIRASMSVKAKRIERNNKDAEKYERMGYKVIRGLHPNGAFFADAGNHPAHEVEVGKIMAENGLSTTLDKEGTVIKFPDGRKYKLPSPDGRLQGHTHEIYSLNGEPSERTVAEAIKHSHKTFKPDDRRSVQAEIAISVAPKGSGYKPRHISAGVKEYKRQVRSGETASKPRVYLHVDMATRSVYYWSIK
jgi:hypothetical protein